MSKWLVILTVVMICVFPAQSAEAHKLTIDNDGEDAVQVEYDDGSFSKRTTVHVLDAQGKELTSGTLNNQGTFSYAQYADRAETLLAEDGMGHQVKVHINNLNKDKTGFSYAQMSGGILLFLALIAIFIHKKLNLNAVTRFKN